MLHLVLLSSMGKKRRSKTEKAPVIDKLRYAIGVTITVIIIIF